MFEHSNQDIVDQRQIQDFPDGSTNPKGIPTYYLADFSPKMHQNEEILVGACPWGRLLRSDSLYNKKVLLRERKRHTARRVASTPYVILTGYPPGRVPPRQGTPQQGTPRQGTPRAGYPPGRVPPGRVSPARVPPCQGTPWQGTPQAGYPPSTPPGYPPGCPMAFWEMLQSIMGYGYPPCGQTDGRTDACQNITFPSYYIRGR